MSPPTDARPAATPVLETRGATLRFGDRTLWSGLDLEVGPGEFVAVLGANGSGKTSLLRAVLGLQPLTAGEIRLHGERVRRGDRRIGYLPQQRLSEDGTPVRARDLVALGLSGHRLGVGWPSRARREKVQQALAAVGAEAFADRPIGVLSGGEQQRIRVAQALVGDPSLLLADEPLISLDLSQQRIVSELIDDSRRRTGCGVLFITHDVNPVLAMVDRVVYLARGEARVGTVDEVFTSEVLSGLYRTPVEVIKTHGRIIVVGAAAHTDLEHDLGDPHDPIAHEVHGMGHHD